MDTTLLMFAVMLFIAIVLAMEGLYQVWASRHSAEARRIAARLRLLQDGPEGELHLERAVAPQRLPGGEALLARLPGGAALQHWVATSGTGQGAAPLIAVSVVLALVAGIGVSVAALPWTFALTAAAAGAVLPWWRVSRRRTARLQLAERQIPEALDLMGRAMRAGHAFPTAMKMVGGEMPEPLGAEFRKVVAETSLGSPQEDALNRLAERVPVDDLRYFVIAVLIQRQSGGNLSELLGNISAIVRARLKLMGEVRTLSAEGRLSAWILGLLPFCVAGVVHLTNPDFLRVLYTDPMGIRMIGGALLLMAVGIVWMRKIIRIRV